MVPKPDLITLLTVLLISILSGIASIFKKTARGTPYHFAWVASDFICSLLAGYLAYQAYPALTFMPDWFGLYLFVAACAHLGSKLFQMGEEAFVRHFEKLMGRKPNEDDK